MRFHMKLTVIIEKSESDLWGRIENVPDYLPVTSGKSLAELEQNLRDLLHDYIQNEGSVYDAWRGLKVTDIQFEYA